MPYWVEPLLAGGDAHVLARRTAGGILAWGPAHLAGVVGPGGVLAPTQVPFAGMVMGQVAAGWAHSLATAGGRTFAWGSNSGGELGLPGLATASTPTAVPELSTGASLNRAKSIAAGPDHSLAVRNIGRVMSWGTNARGQLGVDPVVVARRERPAFVPSIGVPLGLPPALTVSAGIGFSVALLRGGVVAAWGFNGHGQLGHDADTGELRFRPRVVPELSGVTQVAAGGRHVLALMGDGTVRAWGANHNGQLGNGASNLGHPTAFSRTPVSVLDLTGVRRVAAGVTHSLALLANGEVWSWGRGHEGQLGDGERTTRSRPVHVQGLGRARAIAAGSHYSLALVGNRVFAWGDDTMGQMGRGVGNMEAQVLPVEVPGASGIGGWP